MRALRTLGLVLLFGAAAAAFALVVLAQSCALPGFGPNSPQAPSCEEDPSPVGLVVGALLAVAAGYAAFGRVAAACVPWALATGISTLFGLSHGTLLYPCAAALLGLVLAGVAGRRSRSRSTATPAT